MSQSLAPLAIPKELSLLWPMQLLSAYSCLDILPNFLEIMYFRVCNQSSDPTSPQLCHTDITNRHKNKKKENVRSNRKSWGSDMEWKISFGGLARKRGRGEVKKKKKDRKEKKRIIAIEQLPRCGPGHKSVTIHQLYLQQECLILS